MSARARRHPSGQSAGTPRRHRSTFPSGAARQGCDQAGRRTDFPGTAEAAPHLLRGRLVLVRWSGYSPPGCTTPFTRACTARTAARTRWSRGRHDGGHHLGVGPDRLAQGPAGEDAVHVHVQRHLGDEGLVATAVGDQSDRVRLDLDVVELGRGLPALERRAVGDQRVVDDHVVGPEAGAVRVRVREVPDASPTVWPAHGVRSQACGERRRSSNPLNPCPNRDRRCPRRVVHGVRALEARVGLASVVGDLDVREVERRLQIHAASKVNSGAAPAGTSTWCTITEFRLSASVEYSAGSPGCPGGRDR